MPLSYLTERLLAAVDPKDGHKLVNNLCGVVAGGTIVAGATSQLQFTIPTNLYAAIVYQISFDSTVETGVFTAQILYSGDNLFNTTLSGPVLTQGLNLWSEVVNNQVISFTITNNNAANKVFNAFVSYLGIASRDDLITVRQIVVDTYSKPTDVSNLEDLVRQLIDKVDTALPGGHVELMPDGSIRV